MKIATLESSTMHSHWQQQGDNPLFPDLLWSRPENKFHAGKLLIIGGTGQEFAGAAESYAAAEKAGIGTVRIMLPNSLHRTVAKLFPAAEFAPSTPSGSFGMSALAELLDAASWADGVLIAGDTGYNSETTQLLEEFLTKYNGQLTLFGDTIATLTPQFERLLDRPQTTLVLTLAELQKLAVAAHHTVAFTTSMGIVQLVEALVDFNKLHAAHLVVAHDQTVAVAVDGRISTTSVAEQSITQLASSAATWWLQTPTKPYEALTTSLATLK